MIEILAQAQEVAQSPEAAQVAAEGITGSIQGGLGCLGAAIGVGIVGMKAARLSKASVANIEIFNE